MRLFRFLGCPNARHDRSSNGNSQVQIGQNVRAPHCFRRNHAKDRLFKEVRVNWSSEQAAHFHLDSGPHLVLGDETVQHAEIGVDRDIAIGNLNGSGHWIL
jgi:hypothetical protein